MINEINSQIQRLEKGCKIVLAKGTKGMWVCGLEEKYCQKCKAKLDQAKKDKEIIEKGLEDLKQEIKQEWVILDDVPRLINQKLKNQNGH